MGRKLRRSITEPAVQTFRNDAVDAEVAERVGCYHLATTMRKMSNDIVSSRVVSYMQKRVSN
jgi:hypothetical protein